MTRLGLTVTGIVRVVVAVVAGEVTVGKRPSSRTEPCLPSWPEQPLPSTCSIPPSPLPLRPRGEGGASLEFILTMRRSTLCFNISGKSLGLVGHMEVSLTLTRLWLSTLSNFYALVVLCKLHVWKALRWGQIQLQNPMTTRLHIEEDLASPIPLPFGITTIPANPATWRTELVHTGATTQRKDGMSMDVAGRPALEVRYQVGGEPFRIPILLPSAL